MTDAIVVDGVAKGFGEVQAVNGIMLAKTSGAILFGVANAFVPVVMAAFLDDFSSIANGCREGWAPTRCGNRQCLLQFRAL